jgi:hypothetical protein
MERSGLDLLLVSSSHFEPEERGGCLIRRFPRDCVEPAWGKPVVTSSGRQGNDAGQHLLEPRLSNRQVPNSEVNWFLYTFTLRPCFGQNGRRESD